MDVAYFLRRRTSFIRWYYSAGVEPFRDIQRRIDHALSPYDELPSGYDPEDGKPAYLAEWIEADEAAQVVGRSAVSLLSDTLKLYFKALEAQLGFSFDKEDMARAKKEGFVAAYKSALREVLKLDWADCPVDFDVIEQVVLARNRSQHGDDLATLWPRHDAASLSEHQDLIFASERELKMWVEEGANPDTWIAPRVDITDQSLHEAIAAVDDLADCIERKVFSATRR